MEHIDSDKQMQLRPGRKDGAAGIEMQPALSTEVCQAASK